MNLLNSTSGKWKPIHLTARWLMILLVLVFQLAPAAVYANPSGEQVVAGQAEFERAGSTLTINQSTHKVIINWQDFSIAQGELTKFLQPSASSAALNRVVGGNLSQIYGSLQANGTVILINPNGITVGPGGQIDVGTFMGSTLDISNDQFLQGGDLNFMGSSPAAITNLGKISAEDSVFLFAQKIDNQGQVIAGNEAAMAAGTNIYLREAGDDRVSVLVGSSDEVSGDRIRHSGEVQAAMVTMKATGSAASAAVNNSGVIRATGAAKVNGRVLLTGNGGNILNSGTIAARNQNGSGGEIKLQAGSTAAKTATVINSGTLDASGTTGGRVEVTGDRVALTSGSLVDVSGVNGGGTALIGGGWQGSDASVQNADRTYVASGARIKADSTDSGDAGTVVVWSDRETRYFGEISAQAKGATGDGGNVEVSGKTAMAFDGAVNVASVGGQAGNILLDPQDITIADTGSNDGELGDSQILFADSAGTSFTISDEALEALTGNILLQASRDVFFNFDLNLINQGAGESFTVQAGRSVAIASNVDITLAGGNFSITINDAGATAGDRTAGLAVFSMASGATINTGGGNFVQSVGNFGGTTAGIVTLNSATINAGGGSISLEGIRNSLSGPATQIFQSNLTTSGTGTITLTGTLLSGTLSGQSGLVITNSSIVQAENGQIAITGSGHAASTGIDNRGVVITNGAQIRTTGSGGITITGSRGSGTNSNQDVWINGAGTLIESTATGTGAILIQSGLAVGTATGNGNAGVEVSDNAIIRSLNPTGGSSITITGTGAGNALGVGVFLGPAQVTTVSGDITINGTGSSTATGTSNIGVVLNQSVVETSGSGAITITGTGGNGISFNQGVRLVNVGTVVRSTTTGTGAITISGTALASTTGSDNTGVVLSNSASVVSLNSAGGSAISITGTGGGGASSTPNHGVLLQINSSIASQTGDIVISGNTTISTEGLVVSGSDVTNDSGDIRFVSEVIDVRGATSSVSTDEGNIRFEGLTFLNSTLTDGSVSTNSGWISFVNTTPGQTFGINGGAGASQILFSKINPGTGVLSIGSVTAGNITFGTTTADLPSGSALVLETAGSIVSGSAASDLSFGGGTGTGTLVVRAGSGLGTSLNPFVVQSSGGLTLGAAIAAGGAFLNSIGALTFGDTSALGGPATTSIAGGAVINANSPITFAVNTSTTGGATYTSADTGGAGADNITVNSGVQVDDDTSLTFESGDSFVLTDNTSVVIAPIISITSAFGDTDSDGAITLNDGVLGDGTTTSITLTSLEVSGGISQAAGGAITSAALIIGNGAGTISLIGTANDVDTLSTIGTHSGAITYVDADALGITLLQSDAGLIDVSAGGLLTVTGTVSTQTAGSITLDGIGVTLAGTSNITQGTSFTLTANSGLATLDGSIDTDAGPINITGTGISQGAAGAINADGSTISLNGTTGAVQIDGAITTTNATASALFVQGDTITQAASGVINVNGTARFVSTSATAGNVLITNDQNLALLDGPLSDPDPAFLVGGNLNVTVNGDITQNAGVSGDGRAIAVAGATTLTPTGTETVTADTDNVFGGGVTTGSGGVIISKVGVITLGTGAGQTALVNPVTGDLTITSRESGFQFSGSLDTAAGISLAGANLMNEVSVRTATAAGSGFVANAETGIRQDIGGTGTINMTGAGSTLTLITEASSGNTAGSTRSSILLDDPANVLGSIVDFDVQETNAASFGDVLLTHSGANSVDIAASTLRRNLTINSSNAAANFTQSGAITGTTSSRFIANVAGSIDFNDFANIFGFLGGTVAGDDVIIGGDFRFRNANALTLTGSRSLIANGGAGLVRMDLDAGGLTQGASHDLQAGQLVVVTAGTGNVVLTSTINQVGTIAAEVADGQFSMRETDNLIIGAVDGINGISLLAANRNLALAVGGVLTATGASTPISLAGSTGTVEIQADTIGASGSPVFVNGSYTLQAEALSGGIFIENQTANAAVSVANVNPGGGFLNPIVPAGTGLAALGGDIELVLTGATSNLTVGASVNSGINLLLDATNDIAINSATSAAANAVITAGNNLTTTALINGTDISLTTGGALTYGANVGTVGTTATILIDNTGLLTRTVNTATMNADTVTFQGNGGTGTGATDGLRLNTLALILNKGGATTPIRVNNVNAGLMNLEGTVGNSFSLITSGGIQITDNDLVFSGSNVLVDLRSSGSILKQSPAALINFTGSGSREIVLRAAGASTVGAVGTSSQGDSNPLLVGDALIVNNATRIAGVANGGFFVINPSTTALEIGSINTAAVFAGLGTTSGIQGNAGVELYTEGGLNVTQQVTAQTSGYIALVGNFANGLVTINANVRNNPTSGTGSVIIEGTPVIGVAPVAGLADVLISDRNPNGGIFADTNLTGNVVLQANDDYIIAALINHTGATSTLTIEADANNDGEGGVIFISGNNGVTDVHGRVATNGSLTLQASELMNNYSGATILDPGSNPVTPSYTVAVPSRNTLGSNVAGDTNPGNGIVLASNAFAAIGAPQINISGTGLAIFEIKGVSEEASVVQLDANRAITGTTASLYFLGTGDVGEDNLGNVNPLRTQVAGLRFDKATFDVHIREFDGLTITQASEANLLQLEAGTQSNGTASAGSGAVNQAPTAVLTLNELNINNRRGAVELNTETNFVNEISFGNASGNFLYLGGVNLALTGPVSSGNTTTINVGTFDIDQSASAPINATSTINLTFREFAMRAAINAGTSGTVNIFNLGDMLNFNPTLATNRITANTLNITDQVGGGGSIGLNTTSTTLTNNVTGGAGDNYDGFIRTTVATVNISKTTGIDGSVGGNGRQVNLLEANGIQLGSVNMDGDLFISTQATGAILQNPANGVVVGGQAQFITTDGSITLNSNVLNDINAFGRVIALNGHFRYITTVSAPDNEVNFNGLIQTTGGTALNPADVQITFGATNDAVFVADGDIFANDAVTITRFGGGSGQIRTAGNITTSGDNITFTSADGVVNVRLDGDVVHSTNGIAPNPFLGGSNPALGGNVTYNATVDSDALSGPFDLTVHAGTGDVTFQFTAGASTLAVPAVPAGTILNNVVVNTAGTTLFNDDVDAVTLLTDFDPAQRGGTTIINGGIDAVVTTGFQIYNDAVVITDTDAATTNLDGTDIEFNGTLNTQTGANFVNLTLNDAGTTRFNGNVGTTRALQTLTVNSNQIFINGQSTATSNFTPAAPDAGGITIRTVGMQNYNALAGVFVGGGTTAPNVLTTHNGAGDTSAGDILFATSVNGFVDGVTATAPGQNDLVLIAGVETDATATGNIVFGDTVGVATQMGDILIPVVNDVTMATSATDVIFATTFIQAFGFGTTTVSGGIRTTSDVTPAFVPTFVAPANLPNVVQAASLAGGVQISTDQIIVNRNILAENNGIIRLNGLNAASDVVIIGGTVETTGAISSATRAAIGISAGDDIVIGNLAQPRSSIVRTTDGAITLTARNQTNDATQGILIQAGNGANPNNDALVQAQGANGFLTVTATDNQGLLVVNGGGSNGAQAQLSSTEFMTVDADRILLTAGDFNNAIASLTSANGQNIRARNTAAAPDAIILQGGNGGTNARAQIENQNGSQLVQADLGNLVLTGGTGQDADARIRANTTSSNQIITVTDGNLLLTAGNDTTDAGNADIQLLGTGTGQQTVTVSGAANGNIVLQAGTGTQGQARITSNRTQTVTAENAISLTGGGTDNTTPDSTSLINMTAGLGNSQTISAGTTITLLGGPGQNGSAFINSNNTQTITAGTGMSLTGGPGPGSGSEARIVADNTQLITVTTGNLVLTGGNGADATAAIRHTNNNAGVTGGQTINVLNGNLLVTANQDAANDVGEALIQMLVNDTTTVAQQTVNVAQGTITVTGGAAQGEQARIDSSGNQTISARDGITVQGIQIAATGDTSLARIRQANVNGTQVVTVTGPGNLNVLGGRGNGSAASIESTGTAQTLTVTNGALLVRGDLNADTTDGSSTVAGVNAAAGIIATNTNAVQTVNVTNGGIIVQGGADASEEATIQMTGASGRQTIQALTAGNLQVLGGEGGASSASIVSAGLNGGGANQQAQRIIVANGNLVVDAGTATSGGASAFIEATNTGAATQFIDVEGTVSVLGGDGGGEPAFIRAAGFNTVNGLAQDINSLNALLIQSGNNGGAPASIESTGVFGRQQVVVQTGNLSILAGTGGGNQAFIRAAGDNGATLPGQEAQRIIVADGNLIIDANSGTGGNSAFVELTNNTTATQVVDVEGTISVLGGDGGGEQAFIRSAGFDTALGLAQDINALSGMLIQGGDTTGGGNAFIDATGTQGRQLIVVQNNNLEIRGGSGGGQDVRIASAGLNGAGANEEAQRILILNGSLILDSGDATNGGTTTAIRQTNTGAATQFIDVEGRIDVLAGDGGGENASITAAGFNTAPGIAQDINALSGMRLEGGAANAGNNAQVRATGLQGTQLITVQTNNLELVGGNGTASSAEILGQGLIQTITVSNGALLVQANQDATNAASNASITADNTNAVQTINVTSGGIIVQGGVGDTEQATIQMTGASGRQTINVLTDGDLQVLGGIGSGGAAFIISDGLDAGVGTEAQRIVIDAGQLVVQGGPGADLSAAAILQTNSGAASQIVTVNGTGGTDGTVSILGGAGAFNFALIDSLGDGAQTITIARGLTITGGSANFALAGISAYGTGVAQSVTVTTGHANLTGGGGDDAAAFIQQTEPSGTQVITLSGISGTSNLSLLGGDGSNSDAFISAAGSVQTITVSNGNLAITANQNAANDNSDAAIRTFNFGSTQTITVAGAGAGLITLFGGAGSTEIAEILGNGIQSITAANGITMTGGSGTDSTALITKAGDAADTQTITVTTGNFDITGGTGQNADAIVASNGVTQTIDVNNGALRVRADQVNAATALADAIIDATNTNAVQTINVTNGGIMVQGGVGTEGAAIRMMGASGQQNINAFVGDIELRGGPGFFAGATISSDGLVQNILLTDGNLRLLADTNTAQINGDANLLMNNATAGAQQIITLQSGVILVQGGSSDDDARIDSNRLQTITVNGDVASTTAAVSVLGGDVATGGGFGRIQANDNQVITLNGTGGILVEGGAGANGLALIQQTGTANASATQTITVNAAGNLVVQGGEGAAAFARIASNSNTTTAGAEGQRIRVLNGNMQVLANNSAAANNGFAEIGASGGSAQLIEISNGITLVAGAGANDAAIIIGSTGLQTLQVNTGGLSATGGSGSTSRAVVTTVGNQVVNVVAGGITLNGGSGVAADDYAGIGATGTQTITVTAGGITMNGNQGNSSATSLNGNTLPLGAGIVAGNTQTLSINGGNLTMNAGSVANSRVLIEMTAAGSDQTITVAAGGLNMNDGTGADAVIRSAGSSATGQVITTSGFTNLTGNDGFQSLIEGVNNTLNNAGGTWVGQANVVSTTQSSINNTGAILIDESSGFTGGVTTPLLRFFGGTGTVGATVNGPLGANTRLNTFVDEIFFDGVGAKTVNISEDNDVDLRGTIGTVNLITVNAGDITTSIAPLTAAFATLWTTNGSIDMSGSANGVATFRGLVANNGFITYNGVGTTTFANRAVSAEVPAGDGVFADLDITTNTVGNSIFTTDVVRSTGGNIDMTAPTIVLNAAGAPVGGTTTSASDGLIITETGTQFYDGVVELQKNTRMRALGGFGSDDITFNSTITGPGGLTIGSTPNFNGDIGTPTPLAFLILNSPVESNFNAGFTTATINGSFLNQGGGAMNTFGDTIFIVDNGTVGPGPGVFSGGTMNLGGTIQIFGGDIGSVTGSAIPGTEVFDAWTGNPFTVLIALPGGSFIAFKVPNPFDPFDPFNKERLVKRKFTIRYDMAYKEGRRPAGYAELAGIPNVPEGKAGGLMSSTYDLDAEIRIEKTQFTDTYKQP